MNNMLDLTDPNIRNKLGVTIDDLTATGKGAYDTTHKIGQLANDAGFSGIIAPSARNPLGNNVIVFGGYLKI